LPDKGQQILIAAYQGVCSTALRQVEEWLIFHIPTYDRATPCDFDDFTEGKILSQQLSAVGLGEPKFWISKNSCELGDGSAGDQRCAAAFPPVLAEPCQAAI
jgi:hypothetical protein